MPETHVRFANEPLPAPDVTRSYVLPKRFYTDPMIYEREKQAIFYRSWHYLGHVSQLANPGDYITGRIVDQNVFLIRDDDSIRGFFNVCQHRGHQLLADGAGSVGRIVCPYHAWCYERSGQLRGARACDKVADFDRDDFALEPIAVEEFCGLLFCNLDAKAESLNDQAADLAADLRQRVPRIDEMTPKRGLGMFGDGINCGWKVGIDNYLECYHCRNAHPALADMLDMNAYRTDTYRLWSRQSTPGINRENDAYPVRKDAPVQYAAFWFLWPTTMITINPGELQIDVAAMMPFAIDRMGFIGHHYGLPDEPLDEARIDYMCGLLSDEDAALCESVQQGLQSRGYRQGRFIAPGDGEGEWEQAVHHFHRLVLEHLETAA